MSMLDRLEHNLEAAIAEQRAGRVTREQCVEAMAIAIRDQQPCGLTHEGRSGFYDDPALEELKDCYGQHMRFETCDCKKSATVALDAAITSGYVVVNKP